MKEDINIVVEFPALDLTFIGSKDWYESVLSIEFVCGEYISIPSASYFQKNFLNHHLVDLNGNIFKIVGVQKLNSWKKYWSFLKKGRLIFEDLNEKITLEDLKLFLIERIEGRDNKEFANEWIDSIKKAQNFEEVFFA